MSSIEDRISKLERMFVALELYVKGINYSIMDEVDVETEKVLRDLNKQYSEMVEVISHE